MAAAATARPIRKLRSQLRVRNLQIGDKIPTEFDLKLPHYDCDSCWVVTHQGIVVAILIGMMAHGTLFLFRIATLPDSPPMALVLLLRRALRAAKENGCELFLSFLDPNNPKEEKLLRVAIKVNAGAEAAGGVWVMGKIENALRY